MTSQSCSTEDNSTTFTGKVPSPIVPQCDEEQTQSASADTNESLTKDDIKIPSPYTIDERKSKKHEKSDSLSCKISHQHLASVSPTPKYDQLPDNSTSAPSTPNTSQNIFDTMNITKTSPSIEVKIKSEDEHHSEPLVVKLEQPFEVESLETSTSNIDSSKLDVEHEIENNLICRFCKFQSKDSIIAGLHAAHHKRAFLFQYCSEIRCKFRYKTRENILSHYKIYHDTNPEDLLMCTHCVFVTKLNNEMDSHTAQHFVPLPFPCDKCYQTFASGKSLKSHRTRKHRIRELVVVLDDEQVERKIMPIRQSGRRRSQLFKNIIECTSDSEDSKTEDPACRRTSNSSEDSDDSQIVTKKAKEEEVEPVEEVISGGNLSVVEPVGDNGDTENNSSRHTACGIRTSLQFSWCVFCGEDYVSKRSLAEHLISTHGEEELSVSDAILPLA